MITVFVISLLALMWRAAKFTVYWSFKAIYYILLGLFAVVVLLLSALLNVFTVPVILVVRWVQRKTGGVMPYIGHWLLVLYPTFKDPALKVKKKPPQVKIIYHDWLTEPLFWAY